MIENHPISWDPALRVYWTSLWRSWAISIAMGLVLNAPLFWMLSSHRLDESTFLVLTKLIALFAYVVGGLVAVRMALRKRYRGFSIQINRDPVS